ncbi:MBOAT_2 domain-containing protein [Cephalotus follicularis]|uniref:MBOAT_2 domain-containing protein n=1 Tax=Cephalotus follicularis TaxID=3775 RepID=A0A1Q3CIQ1_CEPFO|nr:MBOAT_2 domain-containing protein [Cephalotus follicularis]
MEGEIYNFMKVWLSVYISSCYCYFTSKIVPKGTKRLLLVLPIVGFFLYLPLKLFTINLGGPTAFFIAWLANFKLLLFAFGQGPLSSDPSISLSKFVALSCLPIKIQEKVTPKRLIEENPTQKSYLSDQNREKTSPEKLKEGLIYYAVMGIMLATLIRVYDYADYIHPKIILCLYCIHIYVSLEIILAMVATLARATLGLELEPHFNKPYLSTSLQDFWGRRWNLMVTGILRPTVYHPTLKIATRVIGREWATVPAVMVTFLVSGLMHDLMFFYMGRVRPTWEVTWFFVLHGFCLLVEIRLKKAFTDRCRVPRVIAGPLTIGFVVVTGVWLFFPQFIRCKADVRGLGEYAALGGFVKNAWRREIFK